MDNFGSLPKPFCSSLNSSLMEVERDSKPDLYVIEATSLKFVKDVLQAFNATITRCPNEVRPGVYWPENAFMFLMPDSNATGWMREEVFADRNIRLHRRVAVLERKSQNSILVKVFNVYDNKTQYTTKIELDSGLKITLAEMFPDFDMNVSKISICFNYLN